MRYTSNSVCALIFLLSCVVLTAADSPPNTAPFVTGEPHFAKFGSNKVHYTTIGKGKTTVAFIHGWACNSEFWRDVTPVLKDKAKLILIDLPGHGQSDKPQTNYTMEYFADGVIAVLKDAKVEKATLVGHSMGAPVICLVQKQAPEKVAGLVAVDGMMRKPKMPAGQGEKIVASFRAPNYRDQVTKFVNSMFPNPGTEKLREWTVNQMLETPQHVMASAMEAMFDSEQPDWSPANVKVPVIAINTKNPMWTKDYEGFVGSLSPRSEYRTIEGAGHFLMLEKPTEFNQDLLGTLSKFELIGSKN